MNNEEIEKFVLDCDSDFSMSDDEEYLPEDLESLHDSENEDNEIDNFEMDDHSSPITNFMNFSPIWESGINFQPDVHNFNQQSGLRDCELNLESREIDFFELFLVRIRELRARAHEILVIALEQISRFRVESEVVAIVVKLLDASEQFSVEVNCIAMSGELRRHFRLDLLQRWIGVAGIEV